MLYSNMDFSEQIEEIGCWKKEKVLGAGGFGYVVLWRNKETNDMLALKQCRWGSDAAMTPKHRSRWKLEVDMMGRLQHPNVVRAVSVPPELDVPPTELPLLAMEYCNGGDLRKMLNRPENCCGLPESTVRALLRQISSAVDYLHSMRIIHRDLKPENIVLQDCNERVSFKLIDLGYAKELDTGSLCTSFVGTLQYLAPELFMSEKYSCTVDFWSLGLLAHEVITGIRPFLPDKSPAEWIPIIKKKSSSQIRAYLDEDKNIVFSNEISLLIYLCDIFYFDRLLYCSVLKGDIERWLQIMLEWDPRKRGKCRDMTTFEFLEQILNKKCMQVFCVDTFSLLSVCIDELNSVEDLQRHLELLSGIPVNRQEIILPHGCAMTHEEGIKQFHTNSSEKETIFFLFGGNDSVPSMVNFPPPLEHVMRTPYIKMSYLEQRKLWPPCIHFVHQQCALFNYLVQAFKVNLIQLLAKASELHKNAANMILEVNKLSAKCSLFRRSLEHDLKFSKSQVNLCSGVLSDMVYGWTENLCNLEKVELLQKKASMSEVEFLNINTQSLELQRSPYAKSKQTNALEEIYYKLLDVFSELKKRPKEQRQVPQDNTDMVRLLHVYLQRRNSLVLDAMGSIRSTNHLKRRITEIIPQISHLQREISQWDSQIEAWQEKRQQDIWKLIKILNNRTPNLEQSQSLCSTDIPSLKTFSTLSSASPGKRISPPVIPVPVRQNTQRVTPSSMSSSLSSLHSTNSLSLSCILDRVSEESRSVKQENDQLVER
ncbi:inhibitor of nuclear factor kappa-B kinase subunit alpha-like [Uloborus diversus]|uniref:inhibitor of nuclear factor kappa-B kinase subunit alpha-like n=1 Tax=Uloborus diversus TaxID=327109 RepID=UPI0024096D8B|nr:inhibitor of nuclear factor kappa-B kinase subunit alpha-like [Uloborus diversus]